MIFKESENVELKRSTSELKDAIISTVAILNKHNNGKIYFGIKNDGTITGQTVSDKTIRDISKMISDNTVIHRDYFIHSSVYVKLYDSEIIITNPGELPEGLNIDKLYTEHESKLRNPLIAKVLYYAGFIDAWGRGILNIINQLNDAKLEKPEFEQSGGSFKIVFKRHMGKPIEKTVEKTRDIIIKAIIENKYVTMNKLVDKTKLSRRGVEWNIKKLKEEQKISRIGPDKGGYWKISKKK